mgnify:FL=1
MTSFRARLRAIAIIWLLCQVASLSAFVPGECCTAHAAEAAAREKAASCHEAAAPAPAHHDSTPHEGDACPMHSGKSHDCCKMTNSCAGPGQQLTTLFALVGVLERPQTNDHTLIASAAVVHPQPSLLPPHRSQDAPPPKA